MAMNVFTGKVAALLSLVLVAGLAGCGQKGALYRETPSQEPAAQATEPAPAATQASPGQTR